MSFYERYVSLCNALDKSPFAVGREIGVSNSSTTYWKRGSIPKAETLQKLADYFGVTVGYLLYGETEISAEMQNDDIVYDSISRIEIAKDKKLLESLFDEVGRIPPKYQDLAIHEIAEQARFVLRMYRTLVSNDNFSATVENVHRAAETNGEGSVETE